MQLDGKIALVTGGNSGIGLGTARRLIEEGAFVHITGRRQEALDRAQAALGPSARAIQADVTRKADMQRVADAIRDGKGRLDIVFANAGGGGFILLEDITEADFDRSFDVDVKGVLFTVQTALPLMGQGGSIVLNTSITAFMGLPAFSLYAAGKAALVSFTKTWANELRKRGIRVNAVAPGVVPTEGYGKDMGRDEDQVRRYVERVSREILVGRVGTVEDIGNAVVYLSSDAGRFVNGIEITSMAA
ncbi:SDR family oxidoreductase [Rubellimicrobium aerolatum]|uniref:SDR family oxidoreductase n=1 Tax=Rubellimicrobium aerolatum TaxID=490979 RepID=A0ABW0S811_9RHOB|nr:SDR family oxidoreductase [Rubellimicrobium aerolatum]MBP1804390.1 NAD(P)-dependent dehydrogenase (short-subunit alcohol dehydrogenase family) [Rubellimicrobium aerolatum]